MKKKKVYLSTILSMMILLLSICSNVFAAGGGLYAQEDGTALSGSTVVHYQELKYAKKAVDAKKFIGDWHIPSKVEKYAKKIPGLKKGTKKKYPDLYYTGNKVTIGINLNAVCGKKADTYLLVKNEGSKKLTFYGVLIGMKKATAEKKLAKAGYWGSDGLYAAGGGFYIKVKFTPDNKVKSFAYYCQPTA